MERFIWFLLAGMTLSGLSNAADILVRNPDDQGVIERYVDQGDGTWTRRGSLSSGDAQIGAVEIKDGATDTRATVQSTAATGTEAAVVVRPIAPVAGSGVVTSLTPRVTLATDVALPAGTNNIGDVDVLTLPAVTGGKSNNGGVPGATNLGVLPAVAQAAAPTHTEGNQVGLRANLAGDVVVTLDGEAVVLGAGTAAIGTATAVGAAAHDAPVSGAPVLYGGFASAAAPAGVNIDGDAVRAWHLLNGAAAVQVTAAGALVGGNASGIFTQGPAAHGTAIAGSPNRIGARARTTNIAAVATDQATDLVATTTGAVVQKPYSIPEEDWSHASAAGGIINATAVTIKAAAGAGIRNYITSIQISSDALGAATEFVIRDGAAGTVLWRIKITTAGFINGLQIQFTNPLRSTANTLLEVAALTNPTTGGIFFNAQGYQAP